LCALGLISLQLFTCWVWRIEVKRTEQSYWLLEFQFDGFFAAAL
jgi:hypothetical protein